MRRRREAKIGGGEDALDMYPTLAGQDLVQGDMTGHVLDGTRDRDGWDGRESEADSQTAGGGNGAKGVVGSGTTSYQMDPGDGERGRKHTCTAARARVIACLFVGRRMAAVRRGAKPRAPVPLPVPAGRTRLMGFDWTASLRGDG